MEQFICLEDMQVKEKGNDFEEIEKILSDYSVEYSKDTSWRCGIVQKQVGGEASLHFVYDEECYDKEKRRYLVEGEIKYLKKLKKTIKIT